jgi:prepilin-type N-terminal cleavage/methylation domain-containing protein
MIHHPRTQPRGGFSLLEVLLAMAIFLMGLLGLIQLLNIGRDSAMEIGYLNQAGELLQYTMDRVVAGDIPLTSQSDTPFDDDHSDWVWSMQCDADTTPNLWHVTVTVKRAGSDNPDESWSMSQWIIDPTKRGTLNTATPSAPPPSTSGSGSTTSTP